MDKPCKHTKWNKKVTKAISFIVQCLEWPYHRDKINGGSLGLIGKEVKAKVHKVEVLKYCKIGTVAQI